MAAAHHGHGNNENNNGLAGHSEPMAIPNAGSRQGGHRRRSASVSTSSASSASSNSPIASPLVQTPLSTTQSRVPATSPSTSPILSYFLASQSPTAKSGNAATFPFARNFGGPVFEEDEQECELPVAAHARRSSTAAAGFFSQQQQPSPAAPEARGHGVLRRLSLGGAFNRPQTPYSARAPPSPPPNSAVSPTGGSFAAGPPTPRMKVRRATLAPETVGGGKPRRAPSPMGERILKGHFDGFN
ncbi:hypothetical protein PLICRDRAFT_178855 [Plicaturopsis crispa FD-325 SS-3]|uniref:Uncharacterized protein n=1 Tax=Plicaturopsis crispa FD-325 SS-3 TaxID=944288 RepID=A0A0C9SRX5_PLICR|nr:hypothetical protein PLICRDRAFT_178855 [Plicaturopsis crispa FD-325 SS-3]